MKCFFCLHISFSRITINTITYNYCAIVTVLVLNVRNTLNVHVQLCVQCWINYWETSQMPLKASKKIYANF